jgi:lysyl-tRNA synthetase, class I
MAPYHPGLHAADLRAQAQHINVWPFAEARTLAKRTAMLPDKSAPVVLETGYGPSGLPHIGTFGEVARTTMVRQAFTVLEDRPTRLVAFSDDMDGLRRVPTNVPNRAALIPHLGKPLTAVPDPFGTHESFGHHNNARLCAFLDSFGFEYEFMSATECYRSGRFDTVLRRVLECYDEIISVVLPTLGPERRATYSPFLPICARTGKVLQVPIIEQNPMAGTIVYLDTDNGKVETSVTGGASKLQWKVDWAMRWAALGVDYEMMGKDLVDSARLSQKICRILGAVPPVGFAYELFFDENGEKISKSRGNGLSVEDWLRYAPPESLSQFMFNKPKTSKRLYFDVIPRAVDEYLSNIEAFPDQDTRCRLSNPVWFIHNGEPPQEIAFLSYAVLLNLASVCHTEDKAVLWHFISRYRPDATPQSAPILDRLVEYAIAFYRDFVKAAKQYRRPDIEETQALIDLAETLATLPVDADAETIQTEIYEVGKRHPCFVSLRDWFRALYQILLGQDEGPRLGTFFALYGLSESIVLIRRSIPDHIDASGQS